ncbi:MAG: copper chaperone PCu(A)C [Thermomicrobiales bacterium]
MNAKNFSRRNVVVMAVGGVALIAGSRVGSAHDGMDHGSASPEASPTGSGTAEVLLRIVNNGSSDERLLGGTTDVAGTIEIHQMTMDGDVMSMAPVEGGLTIAAGQSIDMGTDGYHVMLIGLRRDLRDGDQFQLELDFEQAGMAMLTVPVYFTERAAEAAGAGTPVTVGELTLDTIWARAAPALLDVPATTPAATPTH